MTVPVTRGPGTQDVERAEGRAGRGRLLRTARGYTAVVVIAFLALSLPGAGTAGQLHQLRSQLAEAKVALEAAKSRDGAAAVTVTNGESPKVREAREHVEEIAGDLQEALQAVGDADFLSGIASQVGSLMYTPTDEQTAGRLQAPLRGVVTSGFGPRRLPSWGPDHMHDGIDIFAPSGTPVRAAAGGTVEFVGDLPQSGITVILDHGPDPEGRSLHTVYSHLSAADVDEGQAVDTGDSLGAVGNTGSHSIGPHLHFEVRLQGQPVDPRAWL